MFKPNLPLVATLSVAVAMSAVELGPAVPFNDVRFELGVSPPVDQASAGGLNTTSSYAMAPHVGIQWVFGSAGEHIGYALALGLNYDDGAGVLAEQTGSQPGFGGDGDVHLRSVTVMLAPRLVLRPSREDPFDWGLGSAQLEIGPFMAIGASRAWIGNSTISEVSEIRRWGGRADLVLTAESGWQCGVYFGWEGFTSNPNWTSGVPSSVEGGGWIGGLSVGFRF